MGQNKLTKTYFQIKKNKSHSVISVSKKRLEFFKSQFKTMYCKVRGLIMVGEKNIEESLQSGRTTND